MADAVVARNETTPKRDSLKRTYWCHVCSKETDVIETEDEELECVVCNGCFVEECMAREDGEQENHPSTFVVPSSPVRPLFSSVAALIDTHDRKTNQNIYKKTAVSV